LVGQELSQLHQAGFKLVRLWVLDGNDPAVNLYRSLNFRFNMLRQPLQDKPGRIEEHMDLELTQEILDEVRQLAAAASRRPFD